MIWRRSWIAKVEGKKYYLLNLDEEEYAALDSKDKKFIDDFLYETGRRGIELLAFLSNTLSCLLSPDTCILSADTTFSRLFFKRSEPVSIRLNCPNTFLKKGRYGHVV